MTRFLYMRKARQSPSEIEIAPPTITITTITTTTTSITIIHYRLCL